MRNLLLVLATGVVLAGCSARCLETHWVKDGATESDSMADFRAAWQETTDVRAVHWDGMDVDAYDAWTRAVMLHRRNTVEARMREQGYEKVVIEGCDMLSRTRKPTRGDVAAR